MSEQDAGPSVERTDTENSAPNTDKHHWLKPHQWQPGQSGNPKGRPKKPNQFKDYVEKDNRLERLMSVMMAEALTGNIQAAKEMLDRAFGKPVQAVEHGSDPDNPVEVNATVTFVRASRDPGSI